MTSTSTQNLWVAIAVGFNYTTPFVVDIVDDDGKQKIIEKYEGTIRYTTINNEYDDDDNDDFYGFGFDTLMLEYEVYHIEKEIKFKHQDEQDEASFYIYFVKKENYTVFEIIDDLDIM